MKYFYIISLDTWLLWLRMQWKRFKGICVIQINPKFFWIQGLNLLYVISLKACAFKFDKLKKIKIIQVKCRKIYIYKSTRFCYLVV